MACHRRHDSLRLRKVGAHPERRRCHVMYTRQVLQERGWYCRNQTRVAWTFVEGRSERLGYRPQLRALLRYGPLCLIRQQRGLGGTREGLRVGSVWRRGA